MDFTLPPLMFTRDEIVALVAGARLIRAWGRTNMAEAAEEALVKINSVLPDDARTRAEAVQVHAFQFNGLDDNTRDRLDRLERATDARTRLVIEYQDDGGTATTRTIRPLGLWFWGKVWTLVAWCEMRDDFRMFRVDRILSESADGTYRAEPGKSLSAFYKAQRRRTETRNF